jgi:hypothetical protein
MYSHIVIEKQKYIFQLPSITLLVLNSKMNEEDFYDCQIFLENQNKITKLS